LTIYGNIAGGQATASLTGTGTEPASVVLTPLFLNFPSTILGAASQAQNITVSNTATSAVTLGIAAVSGDFAISANTCATSLASGTGCTVAIVFKPTASGARTGTFTVTAGTGSQIANLTAALSGAGTAPGTDTLSTSTLSFAPQQLGTSSAAQQITLTNSGDVALTLIAAQITNGDFSVVNNCGSSLNAHANCSLSVLYQPKSIGPATGTLALSDQYRTQIVALTGTGVAPPGVSLSPINGLTFPATGVGLSSAAQTVTLTNNGGQPLAISSVNITGEFALPAGGNTCGTTLPVGAACAIQVVFAPASSGAKAGTLTVLDNAANPSQLIPLAGSAIDFTLATNGPSTVTVSNGLSATFPLLLSSDASVTGTAIFTCAGAPANSTCNITPASAALGSATTVSVTIQTGVAATSQNIFAHNLWWATLIPVGLLGLRRRFLCAVLLSTLILCAGCGSGRMIPPASAPGGGGSTATTPSGTYNITVAAASAGLVRTVNLTLVVK
jgi:hypothetical protein